MTSRGICGALIARSSATTIAASSTSMPSSIALLGFPTNRIWLLAYRLLQVVAAFPSSQTRLRGSSHLAKCSIHSNDEVGVKAIRLVANKLFLLNYAIRNYRTVWTMLLSVVDQQVSEAELKMFASTGLQKEVQKENILT